MNGKDFLQAANTILLGKTEAEWPSAVSRAYYAAVRVARDLLTNCGFQVPYADRAHAYLSLRLANAGHPAVRQAGNDLTSLRQERNRADYHRSRSFAHTKAAKLVQDAAMLIGIFETAAIDPAIKTLVTDAMRIYERDALQDVTWRP